MNKNLIIVAVLAVLVIVSAIQAVQLIGLKDKISTGTLNIGTKSSASAPQVTASGGQSGGSLDDLPSMVGGC